MANKYAEDIRQIVGVDGTKGGIAAPEPKRSIAGGRGIAWFNSDGSIGSGSGSSGGSGSPTIQPTDADDGTGNASGTTGGGGGGSTGDSGIAQDDATTPDSVDATALFDNLAIGASSPSEITGLFDCNTNQEYIIRTDGEFTAPDGWDGGEDPPTAEGYFPGYYWNVLNDGGNPGGRKSTHKQVYDNWVTFYDNDFWLAFEFLSVVSTDTTATYTIRYHNYSQWITVVLDLYRYACGGITDDYCTVVPYETEWPAEMPAQLTYDQDTATWLTSDYDTNIPLEYSGASASQIQLCDSNGDQIQIQPSTNGGLVYTNATDNIFWVRGPDGKITAAGSGSARDMYVAK